MLTTAQAAQALGVSARRIRALIAAGRLRATRAGRDWAITEVDLAAVARRPVGRPLIDTQIACRVKLSLGAFAAVQERQQPGESFDSALERILSTLPVASD